VTTESEIEVEDDLETRLTRLVAEIEYKAGYRLLCARDKKDPAGRFYLQVECDRPDVYTGVPGVGHGGKAYLSEHMTDGEIVRRAFALFMAYEEHECREWFRWRQRAVFGPHIDTEALWSVADQMDYRL
jgi:uncharacterized protein (DUF2461 family)